MSKRSCLIALGLAAVAATVGATSGFDFGQFRDNQLEAHSMQVFGVVQGVPASSRISITAAEANADPTSLVTLAKGLHAYVVTAKLNTGSNIDMMALWPNDETPTHGVVLLITGWH